jgi:hypothetical protein
MHGAKVKIRSWISSTNEKNGEQRWGCQLCMLRGVEWPGDCECGNRKVWKNVYYLCWGTQVKCVVLTVISRIHIMNGRPHGFVTEAVITVLWSYRRYVGSNKTKELSGRPWKKASLSGHSSEQNDGNYKTRRITRNQILSGDHPASVRSRSL